jgi:hypothetical protein
LNFSANRYQINETTAGGIRIYDLFPAGAGRSAQDYLTASGQYVEMYSEMLGGVPFPNSQ